MDLTFSYQLIPSAVSILLIVLSSLGGKSFENEIEQFPRIDPDDKIDIKLLAKDWNYRLGFHAAMLSAFGSVVAVTTDSIRIWLLVAGVMTLAVAWYLAQQLLSSKPLGSGLDGRFPLVWKLDAALVVVNLAIMAATALGPDDRRADVFEFLRRLWQAV